jgi:hypothetical protein
MTPEQIIHDEDAYLNWPFPHGPWGWNPDGTSLAPTALLRAAHIAWYHDVKEGITTSTEWIAIQDAIEAFKLSGIGGAGTPIPADIVLALLVEDISTIYEVDLHAMAQQAEDTQQIHMHAALAALRAADGEASDQYARIEAAYAATFQDNEAMDHYDRNLGT